MRLCTPATTLAVLRKQAFQYNCKKEEAMKGTRVLSSTMAVLLVAAPSAFASTTTRVFCSSTLVLAFVGFLALIVIVQLIPAMMTLIGSLKGLTKKGEAAGMAKVRAGE
jgi:hypothetical protein